MYKQVSHLCQHNSASHRGVGLLSTVHRTPYKAIQRAKILLPQAFKVEIEHKGETHVLEVNEGEYILDAAIDAGLDLPHDCRMGVCMTCPGRLVEGSVGQGGSMLSDDVADKGYVLLCVGEPESDCKIKTIPEDELLDLQLQAGKYAQ